MKCKFILLFLLVPQLAWAAILPVANVQVTPNKGDLNTRFLLDGSLSTNVNGLKDGLQFRFKPSRNDHFSGWISTPKFYFFPSKTGNFQAEIQVKDRFGNENKTYVAYRVAQESFRKIRLTASETNPGPGEAVELSVVITSSQQKDKDQSQVRWDFTSDGYFDTAYSISKSVYHVYTGGQTSPTVEVRFPDGYVQRIRGFEVVGDSYRSRTSVGDRPKIVSKPVSPKNPVVSISPGSEVFNESTIFTFDASKTQVSGWLEWSIDGIKSVKNQKRIQHKFLSPGRHQVRVRNCINASNPQCAETVLEVNVKADPTDVILNFLMFNLTDRTKQSNQFGFLAVTEGDRVRFNAQILNNFDSSQKWQCRWDFDGDGIWDTPFSGSVGAEHTYDKTGSYGVKLQIRALKSSKKLNLIDKTKTIIVRENKAPKGKIWLRKLTNYTGEKVFYEAILGDRNSENNVEIRVDSDGDGVWDTDFRRTRSWWWEYDKPGKYEVVMQVRDPQKKVYQTKRAVEILPAPVAAIKVKVSHRQQLLGTPISFDASSSIGQGLYYEWKVVGNPYLWANGQRANLRFDKPGDYTVCLRVTDQMGREQSINIPVKIVSQSQLDQTKKAVETSNASQNVSESNLNFLGLTVPRGIDLSTPQDPFAVASGYTSTPTPILTGMRPGW